MKESAGILLYRKSGDTVKVMLVHPSGNYNRRAPWGIPKGLPEPGEDLETTARRETLEETGINVKDELISLGFIEYTKGRKRVHGFAVEASRECAPNNLSWEIDKAEFFSLEEATKIMHPDQAAFLGRLTKIL